MRTTSSSQAAPSFKRRTWRQLASIVLILVVCCWHARPAAAASVDETDVYVKGQRGYDTYRIPSVIVAPDGTLLAFCEGRKNGRGDAGDIDLLLKRSTDGGRHWTTQQVVWDDGSNTCGNPCPVADRDTGKIWLLLTHNLGQDREPRIIDRKAKGSRTVWVSTSSDNGRSWSTPNDVTDTTKASDWTWYATGPGAGIQLTRGPHAGRLAIPCDHIEAGTKHYYSHIIYSDDHGRSWQRGGRTPNHQVNECEAVELSDGRLLLNMRNYDRAKPSRQVAYSNDGGATWRDQRHDPALVEPICQASIRRVAWPERDIPGLIVFSNPASAERRVNLTVRASFDDGRTWPLEKQLCPRSSAYSCLVALPDEQIGCLYEADDYGRIVFARFSRDWLIGKRDSEAKRR